MTSLGLLDILAFGNFATALAITPGPNNALASITGVNFGWRSALPQACGVALGCAGLLCATAAGVGAMVAAVPGAALVLALGGALYLGWLGVRFLRGGTAVRAVAAAARPPRFHEAVLFQALNPKAWMTALTASGAWVASSQGSVQVVAVLAALYAAICFPSILLWAVAGAALRTRLGARGLDRFNRLAGVMLLATAAWLLAGHAAFH